jgi:hypothetical protein
LPRKTEGPAFFARAPEPPHSKCPATVFLTGNDDNAALAGLVDGAAPINEVLAPIGGPDVASEIRAINGNLARNLGIGFLSRQRLPRERRPIYIERPGRGSIAAPNVLSLRSRKWQSPLDYLG